MVTGRSISRAVKILGDTGIWGQHCRNAMAWAESKPKGGLSFDPLEEELLNTEAYTDVDMVGTVVSEKVAGVGATNKTKVRLINLVLKSIGKLSLVNIANIVNISNL